MGLSARLHLTEQVGSVAYLYGATVFVRSAVLGNRAPGRFSENVALCKREHVKRVIYHWHIVLCNPTLSVIAAAKGPDRWTNFECERHTHAVRAKAHARWLGCTAGRRAWLGNPGCVLMRGVVRQEEKAGKKPIGNSHVGRHGWGPERD